MLFYLGIRRFATWIIGVGGRKMIDVGITRIYYDEQIVNYVRLQRTFIDMCFNIILKFLYIIFFICIN